MDPAVGWLAAFVAVVVLSLTSRINVGIVAVVAAWGVGGGLAGISADDVCGAFPARLFLTLLGVTLLFGAAEKNGSLAANPGLLRSDRGLARSFSGASARGFSIQARRLAAARSARAPAAAGGRPAPRRRLRHALA